jgi:hypothetical protein
MATTPTQRTLAHLRKQGFVAGVVEKWIPQTRRRSDYLGGIDIIAVRADPPTTVGIQATSDSNVSSRVKKLMSLPDMQVWIGAGNELWVMGWKKRLIGRRARWFPRIVKLGGSYVETEMEGDGSRG